MTPSRYPNGHVLYRHLARDFPRAVRGEGVWITDDEGRRYLDACGGAFVANVGHGVREIADAMAEQARTLAYVNGTAFTTEPAEQLAAELAARAPGDLEHAYFLGSGSEAVEAALKLARQYWLELGRPQKRVLLALAPGYHGNTLLALSASARAHYATHVGDWLVSVRRVPAPYAYRCGCGGDPDCSACSGLAVEQAIIEAGPETVAAIILEPIGGSSTGASVPRPDWLRRVREICSRHDVLLVADEVLTGAGRTGTWTACESAGVVPDVMVMGKGIAGGYAPLSAVLAPRRIVDVLARGHGALLHAQTFSHHPVSCAAGLATVRYLARHALVERCAAMGRMLHERLGALRALPFVGDVRGRGLLAGVELVADVSSRAPFPRSRRVAESFTTTARDHGLILWPNVGQADGADGDLVMLAPPFVITEAEVDELVSRFARAWLATIERLALDASSPAPPPDTRRATRSPA